MMRLSFLRAAALASGAFLLAGLQAAQPVWPHEQSDLPPDPAVTWGVLENGLRYAILPNTEPQGRASLRLYVGAGSLHEREQQRGLAHFLEHMAFNGTENFPADTLDHYFQRLGMSTGQDTNAYTTFDHTAYMIELPEVSESLLREGFTVLRDYAGGMLLAIEEIEKERGIILSEKRTRDSVEYRTALAEYALLLPESIVPNRFPIGETEVIANAGRDEFLDFYDTWYRPDNMVVVVVGEVDPEQTGRILTEMLSDLEPRAPARHEPDLGRIPHEPGVIAHLHAEPEASRTRVSIQTMLPYSFEPDTAENRLKYLPRTVAFAILDRRLATLAKQEGAPFSRGDAGVSEGFDFFTNAYIELTCRPDQWEAALATAEEELRRALEHGFQEPEVREIVANMITRYELAVRSAPTRRNPNLARALVSAVHSKNVFTHPQTELELIRPALEELTAEACLEALREVWQADNRYIFITGNLTVPEAEQKILSLYVESRSRPVGPPDPITEASFAYTYFGEPGNVAAFQHVEDLDLYLFTFDNGVRLNLKRTDFEANTVRLTVRVGPGRLIEPADKPGLALVSNLVFGQGGLGQHSYDDLQRILAGTTAGIGFGVRDDAFVFSAGVSPDDLLLQLQLIAAYKTDPAYRGESLRLAQKTLEQTYTRFAHTPEGVLQTEVPRLLASGDHRFGYPPREAAFERTLEEVRAWLEPVLADGAVEIAIVGDIDFEETVKAVAETLGALPARQPKAPLTEQRQVSFPEPFTSRSTVPTEIPRGVVAIYWPTTDAWEIQRTRRLGVLGAIFSDRLREKIREETGGAYSPYAVSIPSDTYEDYGVMLGHVTVDPDQADVIARQVLEIAAELHTGNITQDELDRAIRPRLTALREAVRTNAYWLGSVLSSAQEFPQRLDWARTMTADHQAITLEEIQALARQYLDPAAAVQITVLPQ